MIFLFEWRLKIKKYIQWILWFVALPILRQNLICGRIYKFPFKQKIIKKFSVNALLLKLQSFNFAS